MCPENGQVGREKISDAAERSGVGLSLEQGHRLVLEGESGPSASFPAPGGG